MGFSSPLFRLLLRQVLALVLCASLVLPSAAEPFASFCSEHKTQQGAAFAPSKNRDFAAFQTQALILQVVLEQHVIVPTRALFNHLIEVRSAAKQLIYAPTI